MQKKSICWHNDKCNEKLLQSTYNNHTINSKHKDIKMT